MKNFAIVTMLFALTAFFDQSSAVGQDVYGPLLRSQTFENEYGIQERWGADAHYFGLDDLQSWRTSWEGKQVSETFKSAIIAGTSAQKATQLQFWFPVSHQTVLTFHLQNYGPLAEIRQDLALAKTYSSFDSSIALYFEREALKKIKPALHASFMATWYARAAHIQSFFAPLVSVWPSDIRMEIAAKFALIDASRECYQATVAYYINVKLLADIIATNPEFESYESGMIDVYPSGKTLNQMHSGWGW